MCRKLIYQRYEFTSEIMPFKSEKQRKWMHKNRPAMAKKWEKEEATKKYQLKKKKQQRKRKPPKQP